MIAALLAMAAASAAMPTLSPQDSAAAFRAAGFARKGGVWKLCDDPGTPSYSPGEIETVRDLNGDGRPDAIIVEGSSFCHGNTGMGYVLVSKQPDGTWRKLTGGTGMVEVLKTRGLGNWPDLSIGGPGFCFPVVRWNGKGYASHRFEYEGKPCKLRR